MIRRLALLVAAGAALLTIRELLARACGIDPYEADWWPYNRSLDGSFGPYEGTSADPWIVRDDA